MSSKAVTNEVYECVKFKLFYKTISFNKNNKNFIRKI